ncbi:MAG: LytTR family transcriptional regulator DNA-binding domain-containing protein [Oscillospiraceae bacterium]|nr:LytTR family transcriptional regulator DNA-binding domain-containing protein [Oscillospiraceae bacterium]
MKEIIVRFEQDPSLERIEVLVRASERGEELDALLERIGAHPPELLTAAGPDGALRRLGADEIVSVSVNGKQVRLVTEDGVYTARQSLQSLEKELDGRRFVRISRYELVNLDKVRKFDFTWSGTLRLELAGGMETWASRRCIPQIRKRLTGKE